jgi:hypothetical protein
MAATSILHGELSRHLRPNPRTVINFLYEENFEGIVLAFVPWSLAWTERMLSTSCRVGQ